MFQITIATENKSSFFVLTDMDTDTVLMKSMKTNLTATAKMVRILTTMVRKHVNGKLLEAMATRQINHMELNEYAAKMSSAICMFLQNEPTFKMMHEHPMFKNVLKKYERATLFNQLLTASFSYSDDSRSMAFKDEVVQDGSGTNYKVRMGLLNVDDRLVKITARLVVPISGRFQIMDQGTHPVESSTFEFMRLTLPNDTKTYHELLNAIHSLPLQQIVDVTSQLAGKKIW